MRILRDALDAEGDERTRLIDDRCGDDVELRARVEALLQRAWEAEHETVQLDPEAEAADGDTDRLIGERLGAFEVIERIGRGGMGIVYRGERRGDDFSQTVALKLIRRGFDFDDVQARFVRERRILARLSHPNIARFIDGGVAPDGRPWFALEFVQGEPITRWCDLRRLDIRARVQLFLQVSAAVQYAHTQLIVHRDLKPANVLVDGSGASRLLDFGIARLVGGDESDARLTQLGGALALTPEYAAPEQFTDAAVGVAADVYALGIILYEMIAGVGPYPVDRQDLAAAAQSVRDTPPESLLTAIAHERTRSAPVAAVEGSGSIRVTRLRERRSSNSAYRAAVRGDLTRIVGKALAKEPERRYATVDAFARDLSRWLAGEPVQISGNGFGYRAGKFIKRNRIAVAVATVLTLGLLATSVLALRSAYVASQQREAALAETARVTAVREYIMLMFRDAAAEPEGGKKTARDALARGAEQIFVQFKDRPEIGQATALSLSELYMQLGDVAGGTPLLERILAWPGIEDNPDVLANARYNLAQMAYLSGDAKRARELLDAAQAWWSRQPQQFHALLLESRSTQAQIERAEGHVEKAIATLEAAVAEHRRAPETNWREMGSALNSLVLALGQAGRHEESILRADEAYTLFVENGAGGSVGGLAILNNRANAQTFLKRFDLAVTDFRLAVDTRRDLYGRSQELAALQVNLAMAVLNLAGEAGTESQRATVEEAIGLLEDSYAMALEFSGEGSRISAMARACLVEAYALGQRLADAEPLADDAVRISREQFGEDSIFAGVSLRARAKLRTAQGRKAEALADVDAALAIFTAAGKGGEVYLPTLVAMREALVAQ
jgi:eukaryotic-like serine/threonine-protein kinase